MKMRRALLFVLLALASLPAAGCPATAPTTPVATVSAPVDPRSAHLAQVPATAELLVQADVSRVIDAAVLERWRQAIRAAVEHPSDRSCAAELLPRAGYLTLALLPGKEGKKEVMVLISGDLTAAEVAACIANLFGGELPSPTAEGVYEFSLPPGEVPLVVADLAAGGVAMGTPAGLVYARGPAATSDAAFAGSAWYQRLRVLLGTGPFDLELYSTLVLQAEGFRTEAFGITLQRGATDRYAAAVLAGNPDSANAVAMFVATAPLVLTALEAQVQASLGAEAEHDKETGAGGDRWSLPEEMVSEWIGLMAPFRELLTTARTTVEGNAVHIVSELDPARASPTSLLVFLGMIPIVMPR